MAKEENQIQTRWGIKEDFLLACAVHRYGTNSWDSVSNEVEKRLIPNSNSNSNSNNPSVSPLTCKQKFHDLNLRFTHLNDISYVQNDPPDTEQHQQNSETTNVPWLDELRKLRVAELKREVERYDLSIVSLQLKVKRLKEEREESVRETDLDKNNIDDHGNRDEAGAPESVPGDNPDQSVNGSNSTDPKGENSGIGPHEIGKTPEPDVPDRTGDCVRPPGEESYNGSSDSIVKVKQLVKESEKGDDDRRVKNEPGDSPESVAESEHEKEMKDENSDVQSSVKSEPGNEDQSPAIKSVSIESQPLVDLLENVRSHRLGSIFERRLLSQDTTKYKSLIRQHIDLDMIRTRLEEGWYSDNHMKFFRDLLLLCNNALVFFRNKSSESMAASELQKLVFKEMSLKLQKLVPQQNTATSSTPTVKPSSDQELSGSLVANQKGPLVACRKRSSITAKASTSSERKKEQTINQVEEKQLVLNFKQNEKPLDDLEEQQKTKKTTNERITYSSRNSTKNVKGRTNNKSSDTNLNKSSEPKADKKSDNVTGNAKKKDVANFMNRMKRGSSSDNGSLLETLKRTTTTNSENNHKGGSDKKRNTGNRTSTCKEENVRKEQNSRTGSSGKRCKEEGYESKRSVGRPPTRMTALPPPPPPSKSGKRSREASESEATASSRQAKKRSRK